MRTNVNPQHRPEHRARRWSLLALVTLLIVAACGGGSNAAVTFPSPDAGAVVISARNISFDQGTLQLPANHPVEIAFDNFDSAPHNVAIYADSSASRALFVGQVFGGPGQRIYRLPALPAGRYYFRCDVHPQMNGTVEVR